MEWDGILRKRDGANSGAEIKIYAAKVPGIDGATDDPRDRKLFTELVHNVPSTIRNLWRPIAGWDNENESNKDRKWCTELAYEGLISFNRDEVFNRYLSYYQQGIALPPIDNREIRVIAKRGRTASYVMDQGPAEEIKKLFDELGWEEFKKAGYLDPTGEEAPMSTVDLTLL